MHTPGPWDAPRNGLDGAVYAPNAPKGALWRICDQIRGQSHDELTGNACLIAAAPDMLAALREVSREMSAPGGCITETMMVRINAAIAKAQGES